MDDLKQVIERLANQYGPRQAATLRGDKEGIKAADLWIGIIAKENCGIILKALRDAAENETLRARIAALESGQQATQYFAWLIERNSMFGVEWFCAGKERWTKDANKAIKFPDRESGIEIQRVLSGEPESTTYPHKDPGYEWEYTIDILEHGFITMLTASANEQRGEG